MNASGYLLGHSAREIDRLAAQARALDNFTWAFLQEAGIGPGMRVLDVGCGAGDVSFIAAELVGAEGEVVGLDRAPDALARARARAEAGWVANVRFVETDAAAFAENGFDAIVGRLVLMHAPDPAGLLRRLRGSLIPRGVIAFQEYDLSAGRVFPETPLASRMRSWIIDVFAAAGADLFCGLRLHALFHAAGLPTPAMRLDAAVGGADTPLPVLAAETVRTLLPLMEKFGVTDAAEVQIETLADRLREELRARAAIIVFPPLVGAWARL